MDLYTKQRSFFKNILYIFSEILPNRRFLFVCLVIISTLIGLVAIFQAFANSLLVNTLIRILNEGVDSKAIFVGCVVVGSLILPPLLYILQRYLQKKVYFIVGKKFDILIEKKRIELDVAQYEDPKFNTFINRVNDRGLWAVGNTVETLFYNYQSVVTIIISSFVILNQSVVLFIVILLSTLPEFIISRKYGREAWYIFGDDNGLGNEKKRYFSIKDHFDNLKDLIEVKLYGLAKPFLQKISSFIDKSHSLQKINEKNWFQWSLVTLIFSQGAIVFGLIITIQKVLLGNIEPGTVIFIFGAMAGFQNAIAGLFASIGREEESRRYINDLVTFLKTEPVIKDGNKKLILKKAPSIIFENVTFSYPGSEKQVYKNFSLKIEPGEKIAIIGLNGAGKTTLVKLLCRFYDPNEGGIFIDGNDIRDYNRTDWYSNLGVLFQDYSRYTFATAGEAVSFGDTSISFDEEKVKKALKNADAKFVNDWDLGINQYLSKKVDNGVDISGGQWQKLALAKLFYRNPNIWILDEPTAAIDADAESKIFEQLEKLPKDKTVILISHRFSTVRTADRIIVIDNGKVREQGTHEELMGNNDEYARLFSLQAEGYK